MRKILSAISIVAALCATWVARQPLITGAAVTSLAILLEANPALAANCSPFTYTLTNGTTADANQVMANFNTLLNCSNNSLAHNGVNSDITSLTGLTTPLPYSEGGTGTTTSTPLIPWAIAGGTADVLTASYVPANASLFDGLIVGVRASASNATTTPTLNADALGAHTITKRGGAALAVGDIPGGLAEFLVRYNLANTRWELYNPASSILSSITDGQILNNQTGGSAAPTGTATPRLGIAGTTKGTLTLAGNTSGTLTLQPTAAAGTGTIVTFQASTGTAALLDVVDQTLSGGANVTSFGIGTVSSGTTTIDCGKSPLQFYTNNGAHTLAAPANDSSCIVLVTNAASAGAITFSGFTVGSNTGDALTTTNTNKFSISIWRINGSSRYMIAASQ